MGVPVEEKVIEGSSADTVNLEVSVLLGVLSSVSLVSLVDGVDVRGDGEGSINNGLWFTKTKARHVDGKKQVVRHQIHRHRTHVFAV